jgi:hypothetical protein
VTLGAPRRATYRSHTRRSRTAPRTGGLSAVALTRAFPRRHHRSAGRELARGSTIKGSSPLPRGAGPPLPSPVLSLPPPPCPLPAPAPASGRVVRSPCPTPPFRPRPSPSPTVTRRATGGPSQAGHTPEQRPPPPCSRCAADRPAAGFPPPVRGHKSAVGEPLHLPPHLPRPSTPPEPPNSGEPLPPVVPGTQLRGLEYFQGPKCEPRAYL